MRHVFARLLAEAALRHMRIHDLRHTFASLLLQQGESVVYVKEQLGHSSIQITVDTYGHLMPGRIAALCIASMMTTRRNHPQPRRNLKRETTTSRSRTVMIYWEKVVSRIFTSWNQMSSWLSQLQGLQGAG